MKMQRDNSLKYDITSPQRARLLCLFLSILSFRLFFFYEKKAYDI